MTAKRVARRWQVMTKLDVNEATNRLEDLVASLQSGAAHEIVIEMDGAPAARLLSIEPAPRMDSSSRTDEFGSECG